jgi:hypothetical protein
MGFQRGGTKPFLARSGPKRKFANGMIRGKGRAFSPNRSQQAKKVRPRPDAATDGDRPWGAEIWTGIDLRMQ